MLQSEEFKKVLIKHLQLEDIKASDISDEEKLFGDDGLGLDSVDAIELVLIVEKEYGVKISDASQYETIFKNIASLLSYINENRQ